MHLTIYYFYPYKNYLYSKPVKGLRVCEVGYGFAFNGKERDNEIYGEGNSYDFGSRIYDSRLGRWLSVDPLQEKYSDWTPYNYTFNSPVTMIDPDGNYVKKSIKRYDANCKLIPGWKFWVKAKIIEITYTIHNAKLYNGSSQETSPDIMKKAAEQIQESIETNFTNSTTNGDQTIIVGVRFAEPIQVINSLDKVVSKGYKSDNLIYIGDPQVIREVQGGSDPAIAFATDGGNLMALDYDEGFITNRRRVPKTPAHEFGHELGLGHSNDEKSIMYDIPNAGAKPNYEDAKKLSKNNFINKDYSQTLKKLDKTQKAFIESKKEEEKK